MEIRSRSMPLTDSDAGSVSTEIDGLARYVVGVPQGNAAASTTSINPFLIGGLGTGCAGFGGTSHLSRTLAPQAAHDPGSSPIQQSRPVSLTSLPSPALSAKRSRLSSRYPGIVEPDREPARAVPGSSPRRTALGHRQQDSEFRTPARRFDHLDRSRRAPAPARDRCRAPDPIRAPGCWWHPRCGRTRQRCSAGRAR